MSATHVDSAALGRAFQAMDDWGVKAWYMQETTAWWIIRTEYKIMRKELQRLRRDNRELMGRWMHAEVELYSRPKFQCRRRLQPLVRFLLDL